MWNGKSIYTNTEQAESKLVIIWQLSIDSRVGGASMGPIWGRQDPGGPYVGPMNFAIWMPRYYQIYVIDMILYQVFRAPF